MKPKAAQVLAALITVWALALATGCSHSPLRVDCDGQLEPINPVTPKK